MTRAPTPLRVALVLVASACVTGALSVVAAPAVAADTAKKPAAISAKPSATPKPSTSVTASASASATPVAPSSGKPTSGLSPLTPRPDEAPPIQAAPSARPAASYDQLMAEAAALRARVGAVSTAVFTSKLQVRLRLSTAHAKVAAARLLLDGAPVWTAPAGFNGADETTIFDAGLAPGMHAVTLELELRDDRDDAFRALDRCTSTVLVPSGKRVEIEARVDDDSSMGEFPKDDDGRYDIRIRMKAKASVVAGASGAAK